MVHFEDGFLYGRGSTHGPSAVTTVLFQHTGRFKYKYVLDLG